LLIHLKAYSVQVIGPSNATLGHSLVNLLFEQSVLSTIESIQPFDTYPLLAVETLQACITSVFREIVRQHQFIENCE
jgi:hypothetical protein